MGTQFFSVAVISLLGAMLPGPDFATVTKNSFFYSRTAGYFTAIGIGAAILVHMTYCIFGLAVVIANSLLLFNVIKYAGASYLIYLGCLSLFSKESNDMFSIEEGCKKKSTISNFIAFKQGFLCNLLNPKATLFFLSLFTVLIKPTTPFYLQMAYGAEIVLIGVIWFFCLTIILSHAYVKRLLQAAEKYIAKILGLFLIGFGIVLVFAKMA